MPPEKKSQQKRTLQEIKGRRKRKQNQMNTKRDFNLIKNEIYTPKEEWTGMDLVLVVLGLSAIILGVVALWAVMTGQII